MFEVCDPHGGLDLAESQTQFAAPSFAQGGHFDNCMVLGAERCAHHIGAVARVSEAFADGAFGVHFFTRVIPMVPR